MKIVIFGLAISSAWGNGHATLWRGLVNALARQGHVIIFYERDVPYYAANRDLTEVPNGGLVLYEDWAEVATRARRDLAEADAAIVTSFCPDGIAATDLVLSDARGLKIFYDLDTPVTLSSLKAGKSVSYIGPDGLVGFDLVLSYTGGAALDALKHELGARQVAPLYGHVDPHVHKPVAIAEPPRFALSYLGTFAADRQTQLEALLIEPARQRPGSLFLIGGAQYPQDFPWTTNIFFERHVAPARHAAFFASARLTLNITRAAMAAMGWCPSGRLFEAAACGVPILSDRWEGLESFFTPGFDILLAETTEDALAALDRSNEDLRQIADRARENVLAHHSSAIRARELIEMIETAASAPNGAAEPVMQEA